MITFIRKVIAYSLTEFIKLTLDETRVCDSLFEISIFMRGNGGCLYNFLVSSCPAFVNIMFRWIHFFIYVSEPAYHPVDRFCAL